LLTAYIYNRDQTLSTGFLQREENCRKLGTLDTRFSPLRAPLARWNEKVPENRNFHTGNGSPESRCARLVAAGRIIETHRIRDLYGKRETRFTLQRAGPAPVELLVKW